MTMDERVEAAARAIPSSIGWEPKRIDAEFAKGGYMVESFRDAARAALGAAFPELHGDQPKGWIAPWEPTKEMWAAGRVVDGYMLHSVGSVWDAMRDAYLGKGDGG